MGYSLNNQWQHVYTFSASITATITNTNFTSNITITNTNILWSEIPITYNDNP